MSKCFLVPTKSGRTEAIRRVPAHNLVFLSSLFSLQPVALGSMSVKRLIFASCQLFALFSLTNAQAADITTTLKNSVYSRIVNSTRIPTTVSFLDFRVGSPRRCKPFVMPYGSPDGPCPRPDTTVYPIQYAVEVRENYSNTVEVKRYRANASCFVPSSGGWICYTQGGFSYF